MTIQLPVVGTAAAALLAAAVVALISTPVVKSLAFKVGAVDVPKDNRRMHDHPIPRMGGLAIFFGFILSVLIFLPLTKQLRGMLMGGVIIVILGIFDDIYALPAKPKFLVRSWQPSSPSWRATGSIFCPTSIFSAANPTGSWAGCPFPSRCCGS